MSYDPPPSYPSYPDYRTADFTPNMPPPQRIVRRQPTRPIVTYTIIAICVAIFAGQVATAGGNFSDVSGSIVFYGGAQANFLVVQGQIWRIFTAMFLHLNIIHIGTNMLSLYFIGPLVEQIYKPRNYLIIYLVSGIAGGVTLLFLGSPDSVAVGASGAIAGIFGALGVIFFQLRDRLGRNANGLIGQWFFWLALNVILNISNSTLAWQDHLGGLVAGIILAIILSPRHQAYTLG